MARDTFVTTLQFVKCPRQRKVRNLEMGELRIAIDGPAASGKSTAARLLAEHLDAFCINTGDMYRALTWAALSHRIDPESEPERIVHMLQQTELTYQSSGNRKLVLRLNGRNVPYSEIRSAEVSGNVSAVARIPGVREWLRLRQRQTLALGAVVMEGRDIGTVILPDATHKFFLTASVEERARRRLAQAGEVPNDATVSSVTADIAERDLIDSTRKTAPLKAAVDAFHINTDNLTPEQVVDTMLDHMREIE